MAEYDKNLEYISQTQTLVGQKKRELFLGGIGPRAPEGAAAAVETFGASFAASILDAEAVTLAAGIASGCERRSRRSTWFFTSALRRMSFTEKVSCQPMPCARRSAETAGRKALPERRT